jgi:DNA-binding XRE family transcriptional regulator
MFRFIQKVICRNEHNASINIPSTILALKIALFFKVTVEQLFELEIEE